MKRSYRSPSYLNSVLLNRVSFDNFVHSEFNISMFSLNNVALKCYFSPFRSSLLQNKYVMNKGIYFGKVQHKSHCFQQTVGTCVFISLLLLSACSRILSVLCPWCNKQVRHPLESRERGCLPSSFLYEWNSEN